MFGFALSLHLLLGGSCWAQTDDVYDVGVAVVDITPDYPIRLNGFGFRRKESEGDSHRIHVRALAVSQRGLPPLVLVTLNPGRPQETRRPLHDGTDRQNHHGGS